MAINFMLGNGNHLSHDAIGRSGDRYFGQALRLDGVGGTPQRLQIPGRFLSVGDCTDFRVERATLSGPVY